MTMKPDMAGGSLPHDGTTCATHDLPHDGTDCQTHSLPASSVVVRDVSMTPEARAEAAEQALVAERMRSAALQESIDGCAKRVQELATRLSTAEQRAHTLEQERDEAVRVMTQASGLSSFGCPKCADAHTYDCGEHDWRVQYSLETMRSTSLLRELEALKASLAAGEDRSLREWVQHADQCEHNHPSSWNKCTCGLDARLATLPPAGLQDGILYCYGGCGTKYVDFPCDLSLPTPLWNRIAVGPPFDETEVGIEREGRGGVLCPTCIIKRLAALPECPGVVAGIESATLPPEELKK